MLGQHSSPHSPADTAAGCPLTLPCQGWDLAEMPVTAGHISYLCHSLLGSSWRLSWAESEMDDKEREREALLLLHSLLELLICRGWEAELVPQPWTLVPPGVNGP